MNNEIKMPKPVKERDNLDLLNLICELSGRSALHRTKVLHDAFWEARKELESRLLSIEPNVQASVARDSDSSTSDGKQNNSSNSGEQQPVTGELPSKWKIEYDNDTGARDDYFSQWWNVTDGETRFTCDSEEEAKWLCNKLNWLEKVEPGQP